MTFDGAADGIGDSYLARDSTRLSSAMFCGFVVGLVPIDELSLLFLHDTFNGLMACVSPSNSSIIKGFSLANHRFSSVVVRTLVGDSLSMMLLGGMMGVRKGLLNR